jgi:hypothetical protein
MDVIYEHVAGLDVHKSLPSRKRGRRCCDGAHHGRHQGRTRVQDLQHDNGGSAGLAGVADGGEVHSHVAMEATGVSWKLVWNLLSERLSS